ncbi:DNA-directed RNA polymerase subunit A' [Candidatus Micrarchaeota archaeon]|nr:DNA-directed RNA polymerase subunit A' [Candidatus Micrarchaeota archaeon]
MKVIGAIEFGVFSPEQVRKMSAVKITVPDTYDEDGYPINGGLADQHLGVIDPGLRCKSCGGRMKSCSGHFGHIEMVRPVIHVGFAKAVYHLLKATCRKCSRLLVEDSTFEKPKKAAVCPHCAEQQGAIKFVKPTSFFEDVGGKERRLLPNEVRERMEHISDEDLNTLGVKIRPEWMVLTVLIVPPVTVRPSITLETGERSEDDLTHKLVDVLRINQRLGENIDAGAPQLIIEDLWELLQYHVATFFDNETAGIPPARHRSGRQLKTLFQRLKGKEGRFRYNLSGKRVNFSGRTVISPDPTLGINELGVSEHIARELTVPIFVTEWNLEPIKELVKGHPEKINYVIRPDGKRKKLIGLNIEEVTAEIVPGYTVERQLMDDDIVIFNRQPSLHRVSMMAHHVKVLPGKTFRFNSAVCKPYNADFDGDEMNIHVPQNEEAQAEAEILMKAQEQILSPRNGEPIVVPELDQISGLYMLTAKGVEFPRSEAAMMLSRAGVNDAEFKGEKVSGREILSAILPKEFDFECASLAFHQKCKECPGGKCAEHDSTVVVKNGKFLRGHLDGRSSDKLVRALFKEFGSDAAAKYLDAATKISVDVATDFGISLSLDDYAITDKTRGELGELYLTAHKGVRKLIQKYRMKRLARLPGKTLKETLEEQVMDILEAVRHDAWGIIKTHVRKHPVKFGGAEIMHNSALLMADSGARGKPINVVQMAGIVGQQAVRGKRMRSGYKGRILSHFAKGDLSDLARGFVRDSYVRGLSPHEYFFHAAGGRDSVVDKGVNPAKTGYMQRRLINALQDIVVQKDLTASDAEGKIIQFKYGDDGMHPAGNAVAYGEPVGVIAAQSIGEPGTQMSIPSGEKVVVSIDGAMKPVAIGEFVDGLIEKHGSIKIGGASVVDLPQSAGICVPSLSQEGKVVFKRLISASRHECGKKILEITTRSGRKIRATDNHSFVIRKDNRIIPVMGSSLKVGQRIPVVKSMPSPALFAQGAESLDLQQHLPKSTHWFGSELKKALAPGVISRAGHNVSYTIPVGADALRHYAGHGNSFEIEDGFVYPVQNHGNARIPESMPLDSKFGWFVGAYLSEGSLSRYNVGISNTDSEFIARTKGFADSLALKYAEKANSRGFALGNGLTINSTLLSELLQKTCGKGSSSKRVPEFAFSANEKFISSLLSAYFDGDGNVTMERNAIRASSNSKELIDGVALLLCRLGIFCTKHFASGQHCLSIPGAYANRFREKIGFVWAKKSSLLGKLCTKETKRISYDILDMKVGFGSVIGDAARKLGVPSRLVSKFTKKQEIGVKTLAKYVDKFGELSRQNSINVDKELSVMKAMLEEDVAWDEIVEVKFVDSTPLVYDFSVEGLETFATFDGVITHNTLRTFHYAGVASLAQLGFTRLVEIVDATKKPKSPVMEVYLRKELSKDFEKVKKFAASLEQLTLEQVADVRENFDRKSIRVTWDEKSLHDKAVKEDEIFEKVKLVAPAEKTQTGITVRPKADSIRNTRKITNKLREIILRGVANISRAIIIEKAGEYVVATEGSNLEGLLKIPEVDSSRTTTNDITETYHVLGVEAGRNSIMNEMLKVLTAQGLKVDARHIMLIADSMTSKGKLTSVGRHGLAGEKRSVLARAAFEETAKHLLNACIKGEEDPLQGIAENIIIGQTIPCGTGKVKLEMTIE